MFSQLFREIFCFPVNVLCIHLTVYVVFPKCGLDVGLTFLSPAYLNWSAYMGSIWESHCVHGPLWWWFDHVWWLVNSCFPFIADRPFIQYQNCHHLFCMQLKYVNGILPVEKKSTFIQTWHLLCLRKWEADFFTEFLGKLGISKLQWIVVQF